MELNFFSILYIIWGIALGLIFKRSCVNRNCIIYRAPPSDEIQSSIYKYGDTCYSFSQKDVKCNKNPIKE